MIKLIKDLSGDEIYNICQKQRYCSDCPFYLGEDSDYNQICLRFDYEKFEKALEIANKEIDTDLEALK